MTKPPATDRLATDRGKRDIDLYDQADTARDSVHRVAARFRERLDSIDMNE